MLNSRLWRLLRGPMCLAVLTCTLLLPAAQAAPAGTDTIELVVRTPNYQLAETGVSVPGDAFEDAPGMPRLPVYGALVELPATGGWEISYQPIGSLVLDQRVAVKSVPVPNPSLPRPESWTLQSEEELPDAVPTVDRPDPGVYGTNDFYPASLVASGEVVWQDGKRLLPLRVYPFQHNPVTGELRYHPEIRIQVKLTTPDVAVQPEAAPAAPTAPQAIAGAGGVLRIRTSAAGMMRLTYDELAAKGVPLATTDIATFAMTYLGQPVDIRVLDGNNNNRLDAGELVVFYAEAYSGRYSKENVYFFSYGGAAGGRMASRNVTPTGSEPIATSIIRTARIERDTAYYSSYPILASADHFFDGPVWVNATTPVSTLTYDLSLVDPVTTGNVAFRARFYGGADQGVTPDQSVQVSLNSHVLNTFRWQGRTGYDAAATGSAGWLDATPNKLSMQAALSQLPTLAEYWDYVDWVELDYPALAKAAADQLYIKGLNMAGTSVQVQTTGFTTDQVAVYDVRDPRHPVVIGRTQASLAGATYNLAFWDAWATNAPAPSYFLTTQAALAAPAAIEVANLPIWNTPANAYDYIAIVHSSLSAAIQPLLTHRTALGLRVAKVDVQDIYDEFSGGLVDPEAIRSFLSYAYHYWNGGGGRTTPPAPPKYVLLVGDGHYDFKNATGTTQLNLIPPYLIPIDPSIGETAADNRYVSVDGPSDFMADMAIGRIPAQTAAEVTAVVNKVLAYDDPNLAPNGAWQSMVTFIADSANNPAGDFHALSDEVRLHWLPATYTNRHVYWETDYTTVSDMRAAIKPTFTNSIMVQWFGHASKFRWGSTSLFNVTDVPAIPTSLQWPFSADYSCWNGYFVNLASGGGDYRTMSEELLLTPAKGSAAVMGSTGLHTGYDLLTINQGLIKAVFQDRIVSVGDAVNAAKAFYRANSSGGYDVLDTTVLFGDPAMKLRLPGSTPATPPVVGITRNPTQAAVNLAWAPVATDTSYEVWRGTTPYFDPASGQGVQVSAVEASGAAAGAAVTAVDSGATPPPAVQVIGDPAQNYFWVVRGRNSSGVSAPSNRTGEFDFRLVPGN